MRASSIGSVVRVVYGEAVAATAIAGRLTQYVGGHLWANLSKIDGVQSFANRFQGERLEKVKSVCHAIYKTCIELSPAEKSIVESRLQSCQYYFYSAAHATLSMAVIALKSITPDNPDIAHKKTDGDPQMIDQTDPSNVNNDLPPNHWTTSDTVKLFGRVAACYALYRTYLTISSTFSGSQ